MLKNRVNITCPQGEISGIQEQGHQVYLRIPYVKADRFSLPEKIKAWQGVLDASQKPEQPFQKVAPFVSGKTQESEDCLFLNVYTPKADNKKRAVMGGNYGGGITQGTGYAALDKGKRASRAVRRGCSDGQLSG